MARPTKDDKMITTSFRAPAITIEKLRKIDEITDCNASLIIRLLIEQILPEPLFDKSFFDRVNGDWLFNSIGKLTFEQLVKHCLNLYNAEFTTKNITVKEYTIKIPGKDKEFSFINPWQSETSIIHVLFILNMLCLLTTDDKTDETKTEIIDMKE